MPLFIFIPNEAAIIVSGDLFATPIAPFDSEGHIPINSNIVFGIGATGAAIFDYSSLLIEINGSPVVTAGVPTLGYSLSLEQGHFYDVNGLVFTLNPPSNFSSFSTYSMNIQFTSISLKSYSIYYTFTTSDKSSFISNFQFGNTNLNRYYYNSVLRRDSQDTGSFIDKYYNYGASAPLNNPYSSTKYIVQIDSVNGIIDMINEQLGSFSHIVANYSGDDVSASNGFTSESISEQVSIFGGSSTNINNGKGDLFTQIDARTAQSQGQSTPFPSILGPRFGAKVLDQQIDSLKIQKRSEDV